MKKPRILLSGTTKFDNYTAAVENVGGVAEGGYLPEYSEDYDGLILCGGGDVEPKYYSESNTESAGMDDARDQAEFRLIKAFMEAGKPILGICRGHQVLNVYFGGSLHQHMPETPVHRSGTKEDLVHPVTATPEGLVGSLYGEHFPVNSFHHQAVKELGAGLQATAFWQDTYVEAFQHESLPIFGIQWHPERLCCSHARPDAVDGTKVFAYFIALCRSGDR